MGMNEKLDSEGVLRSLGIIQRSLSLFVTGLSTPLVEHYGDRAIEALGDAFYRWGVWRGQRLQRSAVVLSSGLSPVVLLNNWDSTDLVLGQWEGGLSASTNDRTVRLSFSSLPFAEQLKGELAPILAPLYVRTIQGISDALQPAIELEWVSLDPDQGSELVVRGLTDANEAYPPARLHGTRTLFDPVDAIGLMRRSAISNGGFYSAIAEVAIERFDATGEHLIRRGLRQIGILRGETIRHRHLSQGKDLTIENLMNDWDGPLASVWTFNDGGTLTPDRWEQDCSYCPYAAAWADFGSRGQQLGYMYDIEMHTAAYSAYHPGITVRWDALKTRGDATCNFRLSLDNGPVPVSIGMYNERNL